MISAKDYCSKVCGGKCCTLWDEGVTCHHLNDENLCSIYERRFAPDSYELEVVGWYNASKVDAFGKIETKPFNCGRVENIIRAKQMPEWIEQQCCFAHPELLEKDYEKEPDQKLDGGLVQIRPSRRTTR